MVRKYKTLNLPGSMLTVVNLCKLNLHMRGFLLQTHKYYGCMLFPVDMVFSLLPVS